MTIPINLVCALFGTSIPTTSNSSFNFVVIKVNILKVDKSTLGLHTCSSQINYDEISRQ